MGKAWCIIRAYMCSDISHMPPPFLTTFRLQQRWLRVSRGRGQWRSSLFPYQSLRGGREVITVATYTFATHHRNETKILHAIVRQYLEWTTSHNIVKKHEHKHAIEDFISYWRSTPKDTRVLPYPREQGGLLRHRDNNHRRNNHGNHGWKINVIHVRIHLGF